MDGKALEDLSRLPPVPFRLAPSRLAWTVLWRKQSNSAPLTVITHKYLWVGFYFNPGGWHSKSKNNVNVKQNYNIAPTWHKFIVDHCWTYTYCHWRSLRTRIAQKTCTVMKNRASYTLEIFKVCFFLIFLSFWLSLHSSFCLSFILSSSFVYHFFIFLAFV